MEASALADIAAARACAANDWATVPPSEGVRVRSSSGMGVSEGV